MADDAGEIQPRIGPALTSEEWALYFAPATDENTWQKFALENDSPEHATAALCLYGQPFGFDHKDVEILGNLILHFENDRADDPDNGFWQTACDNNIAYVRSLAARIQALLPPRENA